jgi:hypothetical protein
MGVPRGTPSNDSSLDRIGRELERAGPEGRMGTLPR